MTNEKILEGLMNCCNLLAAVDTSDPDGLSVIVVKETTDVAIRLITDFDVSPDPDKLLPVKRLAVIHLYIISRSISALCLTGPVEKEQPFVQVDEIFDTVTAFVAAAFSYK
jgi:hypothetical protein